ncbi:MAG TPA: YggT family protein [Candidatus Limnocylindria bacterium]|jgi:YggT family protein
MCAGCLLVLYLEAFINVLFLGLTVVIFGRVLLSWVSTRLPWGLGEFIFSVSEPMLAPIRRALPVTAGMDFSPLIALVLLQLIKPLILGILPPAF